MEIRHLLPHENCPWIRPSQLVTPEGGNTSDTAAPYSMRLRRKPYKSIHISACIDRLTSKMKGIAFAACHPLKDSIFLLV